MPAKAPAPLPHALASALAEAPLEPTPAPALADVPLPPAAATRREAARPADGGAGVPAAPPGADLEAAAGEGLDRGATGSSGGGGGAGCGRDNGSGAGGERQRTERTGHAEFLSEGWCVGRGRPAARARPESWNPLDATGKTKITRLGNHDYPAARVAGGPLSAPWAFTRARRGFLPAAHRRGAGRRPRRRFGTADGGARSAGRSGAGAIAPDERTHHLGTPSASRAAPGCVEHDPRARRRDHAAPARPGAPHPSDHPSPRRRARRVPGAPRRRPASPPARCPTPQRTAHGTPPSPRPRPSCVPRHAAAVPDPPHEADEPSSTRRSATRTATSRKAATRAGMMSSSRMSIGRCGGGGGGQ